MSRRFTALEIMNVDDIIYIYPMHAHRAQSAQSTAQSQPPTTTATSTAATTTITINNIKPPS